ncbi:hypothetical protein ACFX1S_019372 [Malus domestica]
MSRTIKGDVFFVVVGAESAHGLVLLDSESLDGGFVVEVLGCHHCLPWLPLVGLTGQSQRSCCCLAVEFEHRCRDAERRLVALINLV